MSISPLFVELPINPNGNDFFIGDIHGAFGALSEHLDSIHFNPKTDRLICVGDLIDRGSDSMQALDWLQRPYVFSVRGNHEELYLQWCALQSTPTRQQTFENEAYFRNGGQWVQQHTWNEHLALSSVLRELPYMLVVSNKLGKRIGVVHAGLPDGSSWPELRDQPLSPFLLREMVWSTDRLHSHLGRSQKHIFDEGDIPGLDAIVCGHTKVETPTWAGRFLHLETQGWKEDGRFSSYSFDEIIRMSKHQSFC